MADKTLVIFDCDGVLVDSEVISLEVERELLAQIGVDMPFEELIDRFVGMSVKSMEQILRHEMGIDLPDDFLTAGQAETLRRFPEQLQPIDGIKDALSAIPLPRCVASSSLPHRIQTSLTITGLIEELEPHLFSASMVENGKPAPDLFLFAADAMGYEPQDCLVIEDSVAGVTAARAAGMCVLGFAGGGHAQSDSYRARLRDAQPELMFDDMRQLPQIIEQMSLDA